MRQFDLRTPMIYVLTFIIVVLLIVMKKMDDDKKEQVLQEKMVAVEKKKKERPDVALPEKPRPEVKGMIGIVIDDFGYRNDEISEGFLDLDANLTYAIIPGHRYSTSFGEKAVDAGYEVIVHMPMENTGKTYGEEEYVLMTKMDNETIERRLNNALKEIPTAIGMNNHQGSKASADQNVMSNIAKVMKEKSLFFLDSRTTVETIGETTMEVFGVPTARRNVFLDNEDDEQKIERQLMKLVKRSEELGAAIGIGHVKPKTLNVLSDQIPKLMKKGYRFEFVSKMLH
ncbi:MAG: divergent polysaccharide deacetylase family protein [Candidatus Marinimicrobia bacterium]|nr:divergent polysaccharide deacetylase family protein [Candidatus Neomarinimicrobiota bacterium]